MVKLLLRKFIFTFSPLAVALTCMCLLIYLVAQQNYRSTANDPQIEVAHKVADILNTGVEPERLAGGEPVDMATSLSVHISACDKTGKVIASTARLNGEIVTPPLKELQTAEQEGRNFFTWQPASGIRCAAVVVPYAGGTVLVGKSLKNIDERINSLAILVVVVWLVSLIVLAGMLGVVIYMQHNVLRSPI